MDSAGPRARLQAVEPLLRLYAVLIHELTDLSARVVVVEPGGLQAAVDELPVDVGAVFVPYVKSVAVPVALRLVTDWDTTAIALTAALLTTLSKAGCAPQRSRVVIAGAARMPLLSQLVIAAGVSDVTTWNPAHAAVFPLHRAVAQADVLIDLVGASAHRDPGVIVAGYPLYPLLALPGLIRAVTMVPMARMEIDVHLACVFALVMATPPELRVPSALDRELVDRVAEVATHALLGIDREPST
jgi:malate dehydrogenase (oxaloacetate-decarboxylating)